MSFSVDDLVASLSSNHIGQEAIDLAALQAQLSQTIFNPSQHGYRRSAQCTTPIARTPTSTLPWDRPEFDRRRSNSVASMSGRRDLDDSHYEQVDAMEDDERMVEDLLFPASPSSASATQFPHPQPPPASPSHYSMHSRRSSLSTPYSQMHYDLPPSSSASMFATSDPFYLAQLQQATQNAAPSFFTQFGKPSQQSPFIKGHQFQTAHPFSHHLNGAPEAQSATAFVR